VRFFHLHPHVLLFAQTGRNFIGKGIAKWFDANRVHKTNGRLVKTNNYSHHKELQGDW
jgi:hypothetical protein